MRRLYGRPRFFLALNPGCSRLARITRSIHQVRQLDCPRTSRGLGVVDSFPRPGPRPANSRRLRAKPLPGERRHPRARSARRTGCGDRRVLSPAAARDRLNHLQPREPCRCDSDLGRRAAQLLARCAWAHDQLGNWTFGASSAASKTFTRHRTTWRWPRAACRPGWYYVYVSEEEALARAPENYLPVATDRGSRILSPWPRSQFSGLARHVAAQLRQPRATGSPDRRTGRDRRQV